MKPDFSNKGVDDVCFSFYLRQNRSEEIKVSANVNESHVRNIGVLIEVFIAFLSKAILALKSMHHISF